VLALALGLLVLAPGLVLLLSGGSWPGKSTEQVSGKAVPGRESQQKVPPKVAVEKEPEPRKEADRPGLPNAIGMKLVRIPGATFTMGSPKEEVERRPDEEQHEVAISAFYLGATEVTQGQFRAVLGYNPSYFSTKASGKVGVKYSSEPGGGKDKIPAGDETDDYPVENVSWDEANEFCKKLTEMEKKQLGGWVYRLPREAEWEYACRGGASSKAFHTGDSLSSRQANFDGSYPFGGAARGVSLGRTSKVGSYKEKAPHPFGLCDMHGNVWEWCADWYDKDYYKTGPRQNPPGPLTPPPEGSLRVLRGGGLANGGRVCRSAFRRGSAPSDRLSVMGFRAALVPSEQARVSE
jgi:formylglycine-generating enzyme required for sulfatase activity